MGLYLNPGNLESCRALAENIYVDKSELIHYTNDRINKEMRFMCVSRGRGIYRAGVYDRNSSDQEIRGSFCH